MLGIGFAARRQVHTGLDFFLSGRSLPAWITGLAFIAANLGALEILGLAANGAKYGVATVHFYWIGAVPAMVFLGIVMMPFYYNAKVRWAGLVILAGGAIFLAWALLRPLRAEDLAEADADRPQGE